jgi:ABC-type lipoprotein release transport system permease subunit
MKIIGDKVIFSNGTEKYANNGIIGLSPHMTVSEGYDGGFHQPREDWMDDEDFNGLSKKEQIELANYMIAAWKKFKTGAA